MPTVLPVKFSYSIHDLWFDPNDCGAVMGDHVIVTTERGCEIGLTTRDAFDVPTEELGDTLGEATLSSVVRIATDEDLAHADELAIQSERALPIFSELAKKCELDIKPVAVEYLFDDEKAVCYFVADDRVDFRQLVRDLSHALQKRIDMRQIGVREEAAIVGGFAHCGQELCCRRFGRPFEPVSIRMAKEQDLPLNSAKISGACGRLMCCLRYEFEAYRDFKSRAPKRNTLIDTPLGKAKIIEYNTPKEEISLRLESGKQIRIPLADMDASPAACAKAKAHGCGCRPDSVSRSALDRLNSPEIQVALAELDRKNGFLPPEPDDDMHLFIDFDTDTVRKNTRSQGSQGRQGSHNRSSQGSQASQGRASKGRTAKREDQRDDRRDQRASYSPVAENGVENAISPRKRRRHNTSHEEDAFSASSASSASAPSAASRHKSTHLVTHIDARGVSSRGVNPRSASSRDAGGSGTSRHRRPGDKGVSQLTVTIPVRHRRRRSQNENE